MVSATEDRESTIRNIHFVKMSLEFATNGGEQKLHRFARFENGSSKISISPCPFFIQFRSSSFFSQKK